jgi:hypothetical protein
MKKLVIVLGGVQGVMSDVPESALLWVLVLSTGWCVSVWRRSTGR